MQSYVAWLDLSNNIALVMCLLFTTPVFMHVRYAMINTE